MRGRERGPTRVVDRLDVAQLHHRRFLDALRADRIEVDIEVVGKDGAAQAPHDAPAPDAALKAAIVGHGRSGDADTLSDAQPIRGRADQRRLFVLAQAGSADAERRVGVRT
jgi:hypothetical protein